MSLRASEKAALDEFCAWVRERFQIRVRALVLFGSRARGDGSEESDVDVLVAIDDLTSAEAREIRYFAGDILTRHDVLVSPLALTWARFNELRNRERRIAQEIDRDGVPL